MNQEGFPLISAEVQQSFQALCASLYPLAFSRGWITLQSGARNFCPFSEQLCVESPRSYYRAAKRNITYSICVLFFFSLVTWTPSSTEGEPIPYVTWDRIMRTAATVVESSYKKNTLGIFSFVTGCLGWGQMGLQLQIMLGMMVLKALPPVSSFCCTFGG